MENCDKCYKIVRQSSTGITVTNIVKKWRSNYNEKKHRTTIYRYLNTLTSKNLVKVDHALWYAKNKSKKQKRTIQDYKIERFWREEEEIEHEKVHGDIFKSHELAVLLVAKLPEGYKQKAHQVFQEVKAEFNAYSRKLGGPVSQKISQENYLKLEGMPLIIETISIILDEMEKEGIATEP